MGTVPIGTGLLRTIHSRVSWMCLPVERSITVSAPQRIAQVILSTSSPIEEVTAELPMLQLIFTRKLRPITIGSDSGWLTFAAVLPRQQPAQGFRSLVLADGDELHLRRDDAAARVVHLRHAAARFRAPRRSLQLEAQLGEFRVGEAAPAELGARALEELGVAALLDPAAAQRREALAHVDPRLGVGVGTRSVVDG